MEHQQLVGALLFIGRLVVVYFLLRVLKIQRKLLAVPAVDEQGDPAGKEVLEFRKTLYSITLAILAGQFIPITIDLVNVFNGHSPQWLGILYAISNVFTAIAGAVLIWKLYELAINVKEVTRLETAHVQRRHDKEMAKKQK